MIDNWYLQFTQANKAWDIQKGDPDITIMVMDSGVASGHPDLSANIWTNVDDQEGDDWSNGLPGSSGDDDGDGYKNFCDLSYEALDLDKDDNNIWGANDTCDAGPDGDYGFGPNAIDDYPPGPFGGDDIPVQAGPDNDPWDDNLRGWGTPRAFDDDFDDVQFIKLDDDENGYPDDYHGVNFFNPVQDWAEPSDDPDGLPGLKGWDDDVGGVDRDNDGIHFNDDDVKIADFDGDGTPLYGANDTCDAGPDGDYGFGPNAIDDYPPGPFGGDDIPVQAGPDNDPWDDNLRGWGTPRAFDDDMDDVYFLKFDDEEDGNPLYPSCDDHCPKTVACHGTNMAGIISAVTNNSIGMAGYTWYCKLVPAKIAIGYPEHTYENNSVGAVVPMLNAINYAIDNKIDIINMSLGFEEEADSFPLLNDAFDDAYEAGIICIASAANFDSDWTDYPASHPHVIAVSGVHRTNKWSDNTTYDELVDICAPVANSGMEAYTDTFLDNKNWHLGDVGANCVTTGYYSPPQQYYDWDDDSGPYFYGSTQLLTSGAAAQTSGLAGLLVSQYSRAQHGGYTSNYVDFIEGEILRGAIPIDDDLYDNGLLGAGYINAYRSLTQWADIDSDTTWTGDVYVSSSIIIEENATLTISPGATIYFAYEDNEDTTKTIAIYVKGTLNANGTSGNTITFRSLFDNAPAGSWYGIRLLGDEAEASLSYCSIQDAEYGVITHRTVLLRECDISNCHPCGVYLYEDSTSTNASTLDLCEICNNDSTDAYGLRIWCCDATVVVDSCNISDNYSGIWISDSSPEITYSTINDNIDDGIYMGKYEAQNNPDPEISWCKIEGNGVYGLYLKICNGYIKYSSVKNNDIYGMYCWQGTTEPTLYRNKVADNPTGIRTWFALPIVGDTTSADSSGYNAFDNDNYNIYHYGTPMIDPAPINAYYCYWGNSPPPTAKFGGTPDSIFYDPYLTSDPVTYLARGNNPSITVIKLFQNYPNPLMGGNTTQIRYFLPTRENVTLRIYDVSGRRIKTLVDKIQRPGMQNIIWDGSNDKGSCVVPGVYFYQLIAGKSVQSRKIVLLK